MQKVRALTVLTLEINGALEELGPSILKAVNDIVAAHQLLGTRGIESAGSGRLVGTTEELDTCVAPFFAGHAREKAYEVYAGGNKKIETIEDPRASIRPGDSLLLRSVFDVTGWNIDRFES